MPSRPQAYYWVQFGLIAIGCAMLEMQKMGTKERVSMPQTFISFRNGYLFVYSLMMAGDWLQGPYVYALYQHYGYSTGDIGKLFIAGFGSSMIFGTVVGSMADKYGRKNAALTYVVTYIASCITKHWSDYGVLMLGRFFGGIATSLLFTSFESWLVSEHFKRGYEAEWLDKTFAKAIFLGNGLVSIVSGLLANYLVTDMSLGPVAPFDAAAVFLAVGGVVIFSTWSEKSRIMSRPDMKVERYMQFVFLASAAALFVPVVVKFFGMGQGVPGGPITFEGKVQMLGFLVFEAMVGIFWPSMMKMRSQYVPEEVRSTVMNFFRIPLNLFVCVILYNVALFPLSAMFAMCTLFLVLAAILQQRLEVLSTAAGPKFTALVGKA